MMELASICRLAHCTSPETQANWIYLTSIQRSNRQKTWPNISMTNLWCPANGVKSCKIKIVYLYHSNSFPSNMFFFLHKSTLSPEKCFKHVPIKHHKPSSCCLTPWYQDPPGSALSTLTSIWRSPRIHRPCRTESHLVAAQGFRILQFQGSHIIISGDITWPISSDYMKLYK